ncbi:hypothetical protein [Parapedobacter sp. 10938]|uniref:hypothetical protein n=1 Tax=Parapedobacter flavus TaxID=3110225 RepID=UPI002DBF5F4C|nr:hypothetical protein [Parapedobacter sp. 10938]MEC3878807.1 hypothetical protein [Parapedobacter sp. 10938]
MNNILCKAITLSLVFFGSFQLAKPEVIILTSDQQLRDLMDPDKKIDMSLGHNRSMRSLRDVCESGQRHGHKELTIAFDEFFRQYRPQAGTERRLTPDMDEYVEKIKFISDFAKQYGMGICLSLLSPLELGPAYKNQTDESGRWLGYKVGLRNPSDGSFSLSVWQQLFWTNNKGKFRIGLKSVKAYAFKEKPVKSSGHIAVDPDDIIEIKGITYEAGDTVDVGGGEYGIQNDPDEMIYPVRNLRVYYDGPQQLAGYDRVMVLLEYETPEMDYFSKDAPGFLQSLIKKYKDSGVNLTSFYSDEMHIQQDWVYFSHHEGGQFNTRFLTEGFSEQYQQKYGQALDDKYMLYFVYGAPYYQANALAVKNVQYVMGETPEDIHRTYLLRDRYYKMLNHGVVDLFKDAKDYAEELFGHEMPTSAHASWAESPTIDLWDTEKLHQNAYRYEYTSNFVWGNTVHQASAACYDYFKWGEYLQPTGNDFAECGWGDRNYYGAAMGTSIGVVNKYPNAYAAAWGFPKEALHWKNTINDAFGARPGQPMKLMTDNVHRDIEVLILYPMNLVAVEERFGSWMTQYGYANYLTADKLLEMGEMLPDGRIQVAEKTYSTVVAVFEPLPEAGLLDMMGKLVENGGNVIWSGMPPLIDSKGERCVEQWQSLFGVTYETDEYPGEIASGKQVAFEHSFSTVPTQLILTDFLVDRIYPVATSSPDIEVVAKVEDRVVGTKLKKGKGHAYYLGFRPRDDQSASLGYEARTLFEILNAANAYPATGAFTENDNPTYVSRTTDFFATKFPNGTTAIVKHYRTHRENWEGGFSRDAEADAKALAVNPLPSDELAIRDLKINGHTISYNGKMNVAFRTDEGGRLIAFNGEECTRIVVDGTTYSFSENPMDITYAPVAADLKTYRLRATGQGEMVLPMPAGFAKATVKNGKSEVKHKLGKGNMVLNIDEDLAGKWLDIEYR